MQISYKLDLDRYQVMEIIEMVEAGVLTAAEVRESGRCNTEFGDVLKSYVRMKIKSEGTATRRLNAALDMYDQLTKQEMT